MDTPPNPNPLVPDFCRNAVDHVVLSEREGPDEGSRGTTILNTSASPDPSLTLRMTKESRRQPLPNTSASPDPSLVLTATNWP